MSTSLLIPKDIVTVRHLNQKDSNVSNMIISRLLKYNFKKTAEKCDSNSKVYKAQEVNKPQLVLVHHLRFYGTKRSSRHQDGTKDKDMTQSPSLKP